MIAPNNKPCSNRKKEFGQDGRTSVPASFLSHTPSLWNFSLGRPLPVQLRVCTHTHHSPPLTLTDGPSARPQSARLCVARTDGPPVRPRPDSAWTGPAPRDPDLAPLTIPFLILTPSRGTATQCSVPSTRPAPRSTRLPKASPPRARQRTHFPAHSLTQPHGLGSRADLDSRGPRA
jgi:hypothetical protein